MRYIDRTNRIVLEYGELVPRVMSVASYKHNKAIGNIEVLGYGGNGRVVEVYYDSLPYKYRAAVEAEYGNLEAVLRDNPIKKLIKPDVKARQFYAEYQVASPTQALARNDGQVGDSGDRASATRPYGKGVAPRYLPIEEQERLVRQAEWLNMILTVMRSKKAVKDVLGMVMEAFWQQCVQLAKTDKPVNPELPENVRALKRKVQEYKEKGYECLVSKKYGNQNTRKVDRAMELLICSLAVQPDYKPNATEVCGYFKEFMRGRRKVVNLETGEVLVPEDFLVNGEVVVPAESTVKQYINMPRNIVAIDKCRASMLGWRDKHKPHVVRKTALLAFSKVTMDDRDLPFEDLAGNRSVKCYMIIDVASECYVGKAYGKEKGVELIRSALRDMAALILRKGWGFPYEIEFERHLTDHLMGKVGEDGEFINDVLTEGFLFMKFRRCLGGSPQEKRAEHFFRRKKYSLENKRAGFLGRFYAKNLTNRLNSDKAKVRYMYEDIVQHDLDTIEEWNNSLHTNQELYRGMTRWEVLESCQNPKTVKHPAETIVRHIGHSTRCSLIRFYLNVQGSKYMLDDVWAVKNIARWNFDCYYIPGELGIEHLYLYQGDRFIVRATKVVPFQEAAAEQTEADLEAAEIQYSYLAQCDRMIRERRGEFDDLATVAVDGSLNHDLGDFRRATPNADEGGVEVASLVATLPPRNDEPVRRTFEQRILDSI